MIHMLRQLYNMQVEHLFMHDEEYYFSFQQKWYVLKKTEVLEKDIAYCTVISETLRSYGEPLTNIVPSKEGRKIVDYQDNRWILFEFPLLKRTFDADALLRFHQVGMFYYEQQENEELIGIWHQLFEKRYEQCKKWEQEVKDDSLRPLFLYTYGVLDQSIQLISEVERIDRYYLLTEGTVCFDVLPVSLVEIEGGFSYLNHQLLIDHPIRDVVEYTRFHIEKGNIEHSLAFVRYYLQKADLFEGAYRLFIGRLLYPKTILDLVEQWTNERNKEKKAMYLYHIKQYKRKLPLIEKAIQKVYQSVREDFSLMIPSISWLES